MKAERESDGERARESGGIFSFKRVTGCNITYSEPLRDAHGNQLESGHYRNSRRVVRAAFKIKPGSLFKSHFSWYAPKTPFMCLSLVSFFSHGCQSTCKACSLREGKPASRVEGRNLIFCEHWWYQYSRYLENSRCCFFYTCIHPGEWGGGGYVMRGGIQEGFPWAFWKESERKRAKRWPLICRRWKDWGRKKGEEGRSGQETE